MDLEINVLGDGAYVLAVLNAVSGFTQAEYGTLGAIGMLLGMLLMMLKGIMEPGGPKFAPQTLLISIVIFWVMFIPRVDRVIVAEVTVRPGEAAPRSFVVDNVPLGLAGAGYLISNLGVQITKAYETGFGSAEDTERGTTGGLGRNLALMGQLRTMVSDPRFYDPPEGEDRSVINTFRTNMTEYMGQCTLPQVEARNLAPEKIFSEPGISGVVNDITANPVSAMVWTDINGAIETITCRDAAGRITSTYENGNELEGAFNRAMQASGSEIESDDVVEAFANYANSSGISMQRMMATMMVNSVASEAAVRSSLSPADTQAIIMVEEAAQRRNVQWAGEESLFIRILRPIVGFFEALFYALAPIMAFICTLGPIGWKLLGKYTMLTIWVGLWFPMLSLTQLYSNIEMRYFFDTLGNGGDYSPDQLTKIATEAMDTLGTASALTAATPALAMSLIYGGAVSMSYLAGRLQGSDHIDEGKVAPKASDVAAVASTQAAFTGSMHGGQEKTGANIPRLDLGTATSSGAKTAETHAAQQMMQFSKSLSNVLSKAEQTGISASDILNSNEGRQLIDKFGDALSDLGQRDARFADQAHAFREASAEQKSAWMLQAYADANGRISATAGIDGVGTSATVSATTGTRGTKDTSGSESTSAGGGDTWGVSGALAHIIGRNGTLASEGAQTIATGVQKQVGETASTSETESDITQLAKTANEAYTASQTAEKLHGHTQELRSSDPVDAKQAAQNFIRSSEDVGSEIEWFTKHITENGGGDALAQMYHSVQTRSGVTGHYEQQIAAIGLTLLNSDAFPEHARDEAAGLLERYVGMATTTGHAYAGSNVFEGVDTGTMERHVDSNVGTLGSVQAEAQGVVTGANFGPGDVNSSAAIERIRGGVADQQSRTETGTSRLNNLDLDAEQAAAQQRQNTTGAAYAAHAGTRNMFGQPKDEPLPDPVDE